MICVRSEVIVTFIFLFLRCISSNKLFRCGDHLDSMKLTSGENTLSVTIPGSLMSNFISTKFRLESDTPYSCDMNYEVIKINLIGSGTMNINLSPPQPVAHELQSYKEESENRGNSSTVTNKLYGPFPKSTNNSYFESFMYSVENITAIFDTSGNVTEEHQICDRKLSRSEVHFTPIGVLFYSGEYYRPTEYCVFRFDEVSQEMTIKKCNVDCNNKQTPCIPLCCHLHEYIDLSVSCCQATLGSKPMFQPVIYDEINRRLSLEEVIEPSGISEAASTNWSNVVNDAVLRPHYVTFKYSNACPGPSELEPLRLFFNENGNSDLNTRIHIKSHGKAAYIGDDRNWHFLDNFCVAGIVNAEGLEDGMEAMTMILDYCLEEEEVHEEKWPNYLLIGVLAFSSVFLLLTVIVYVLLWERQNIHGWTILSFVISEFFFFVFMLISYALGLFAAGDDASRTPYCTGSGILAHFFFLSTFSWLTVINLDLWWTFRSLTPLSERSKGGKRFCLYMAFAWGIPIAVVSVGLAFQSIYKDNTSNIIIPDYGNRECFLARQAKGVYLYYIIGALLVMNCILISLTFLTIYKFKQSTRVASASSSRGKERSFWLFLKLVVVMGVTWIFEFILWLDTGEIFSWTFLVVDLLNVLQAVATFFIFVCKRKIINQLEQKHPRLKVITRPLLKVVGARSSILLSSTSSKPTRSTTAGSSSILKGSRSRSVRRQTSTTESKH